MNGQLCLLLVLGVSVLAQYGVQGGQVQTAGQESPAFQSGLQYLYQYSSVASLHQEYELTVQSKVLVKVLDSNEELVVEFRDTTFDSSPSTLKLSRWFSITVGDNGQITAASYPAEETEAVLAFKKTVAKLLVVGPQAEQVSEGDELVLVETQLNNGVTSTKSLTLDGNNVLISAQLTEGLAESSEPPLLLTPSLQSTSTLELLESSPISVSPTLPPNLVSGTIEIGQVNNYVSLTEILADLVSTLDMCSGNCVETLVNIFRKLSPESIETFLDNHLASPSETKLQLLISSLSQSGASTVNPEISWILLHKVLELPNYEDLLTDLLKQFTIGRFVANKQTVESVIELINHEDAQIGQGALLALGGISHAVRNTDPELANQIVDELHDLLDHLTGGRDLSRLRRSTEDSLEYVTVIDSIGNARSERSLQHLADHVSRSHDIEGELAVKHAAVNALRGLQSSESAELLARLAETTALPSVQHLAVRGYHQHPRGTRDLSHLLQDHHRARRQVSDPFDHVTNVTMPTISWSRQFGESNVSVDVRRTLRNSFDIGTATLSSEYTFSLHDDTAFTADMALSDGGQRSEMLRTEICLQGTAAYDSNILTELDYNLTAAQFQQLSSSVPILQTSFSDSYTSILIAESAYEGLADLVQSSLDNLPSAFSLVDESLEDYKILTNRISSNFVLKSELESSFQSLNQSFIERRGLAMDSIQLISSAAGELLPSRPAALSAALSVGGQPFTESSFYLPYLPFAPQQALANILQVVQSAVGEFSSLELSALSLLNLTGVHGHNSRWLGPVEQGLATQLAINSAEISNALELARICDPQEYDGASLSELQALSTAAGHLLSAVEDLESVGGEIISISNRINSAYQTSRSSVTQLEKSYDQSRYQVDAIFGPKFHPNFPRRIRSCDESCGNYPSHDNGLYNAGIDLVTQPPDALQFTAPFTASVQSLELTDLPVDLRDLYTSNVGSALLIPAESALSDIRIIVPNFHIPLGPPQIVQSGASIDGSLSYQQSPHLHVEMFKVVKGVWFTVDPTPYLQPLPDHVVDVQYECNDVVVYVAGQVVERRSLLSSGAAVRSLVGDPLVQGIPGHEFPQPSDLVISGQGIVEEQNETVFFSASTFIMVGQIPVQFDFSSVGSYSFAYSPSIGLLSKNLRLPATPTIRARAEGYMRAGSSLHALVEFSGTLLSSSLPLVLTQQFDVWPQVASSAMDLLLDPSLLTLTSQLYQRTSSTAEELLQSNVLWRSSIAAYDRREFYQSGSLSDQTPPVFTPLPYSSDHSDCFVRQSPGRTYNNPAFELETQVFDPDSLVKIYFSVGTSKNFGDIIGRTVIAGNRILVPFDSILEDEVFFTIIAENLNGLEAFASCQLPSGTSYSNAPPLARVVPIRPLSSHPSEIRVLVSVFAESGIEGPQEIAVGSVPGASDVMSWTSWSSELIDTPPVGGVLDQFSFGQNGRLTTDILRSLPDTGSLEDCASVCLNYSNCVSFDFSQTEANCILHSNIQGPLVTQNSYLTFPFQDPVDNSQTDVLTPPPNVYATPPLRTAGSYYYYEKLGAGNSTIFNLSGLNLKHATKYFINVRIVDKLGVRSVGHSDGFTVDLSPPYPGPIRNALSDTTVAEGCGLGVVSPGCIEDSGQPNHRVIIDGPGSAVVYNGASQSVDAMFTSTSNYLTAHWQGIQDAESAIFAFTWCIGTTLGSCDLLPFTDPHAALGQTTPNSWSNRGLANFRNLSDGAYYVTVRAVNNVEFGGPLTTTIHHSTPYIVDSSPPVLEELFNIQYNYTGNELSLEYNVSDPGSGIRSVEIAIGRTVRDTVILEWAELALGGRGTVPVLIPDGVHGWVKLRATNNAGLRSLAVAENAIVVDRTPPTAGLVKDGADVSVDANFQSSLDTLCVNWVGFGDPDSGIGDIEWHISLTNSAPGFSSRLLVPAEVASHAACASSLSLSDNTTYYSILTVYNGAMVPMATTVASNGIRTDQTPPSSGVVRIGLDPDVEQLYSSSQTTLSATWAGLLDYQSGIESYTITIYLNSVSQIYEENISGNIEYFTWDYFTFQTGDVVSVQVEAINGAGLTTTQVSNDVLIDLSPPEQYIIVDGRNYSDSAYQSDPDSYSVSWNISDSESGISNINGAIFEISGSSRRQIFPLNGEPEIIDNTQTSWTVFGLNLLPNRIYTASLSFTNGAGLRSVFETNGVQLDLTPPTVDHVTVIGDSGADAANYINILWSGSDFESGVSEYRVGIVDRNLTVFAMLTVDGAERALVLDLSNLNLTVGDTYRAEVVAINLLGNQSAPVYSEEFRKVPKTATGGLVSDGPEASQDIDCLYDSNIVTAYFREFCSLEPLSYCEWAVGTLGAAGLMEESVMPFTKHGVILQTPAGSGRVVYSGSVSTQVPGVSAYLGQVLFTTVQCHTDSGLVLKATSNGFKIKSRKQDKDLNVIGNRNSKDFSVIWESEDGDQTSVKLGTWPGGDNLMKCSVTEDSMFNGEILSADGVPTFVTITTTDEAGGVNVATSSGLVSDTSPPAISEGGSYLRYISKPPLSAGGSPLAAVLVLELSQLEDAESRISEVSLAVGTSFADQSLLSKLTLPLQGSPTNLESPIIDIPVGIEALHVTIFAVNSAGLERIFRSEIDCAFESPQLTGVIGVLPSSSVAVFSQWDELVSDPLTTKCLPNTDNVRVTFNTTAANSCTRYELGVGSNERSDDIRKYEVIIPREDGYFEELLTSLSLPGDAGSPVYFNIRCSNSKHFMATISSLPIFIKSGDQGISLLDGDFPNEDIDCQTSTTEIHAQVVISTNCPLLSANWSILGPDSTEPIITMAIEINDSLSLDVLETMLNLYTDQVVMEVDQSYRVLFQAVDFCGRARRALSDGFYVISDKLTPGQVRDGLIPDFDSNYQNSTSEISAHWVGFGSDGNDCQQTVAYYSVAIGSDSRFPSTRSDVVPFTNIGLRTNITFDKLELVSRETYFVTVRGFAESGDFVDVTSNGVTVGFEQAIVRGVIELPRYQLGTESVSVYWSEFQSDLPIRQYEVALGSQLLGANELELFCRDITSDFAGEFSEFGFQSVSLDTYAEFDGLNLIHNTTYFITLRVIDRADKCLATISEYGFTVDSTPPVFNDIADFIEIRTDFTNSLILSPMIPVYVGSTDDLQVSWGEFYDLESEIESYEVALYSQEICGDSNSISDPIIDFVQVGTATGITFEALQLNLDTSYVAIVQSFNNVGLSSRAFSRPIVVDSQQYFSGDVKDGLSWQEDVTYQSDLTQLSAVFTHTISPGTTPTSDMNGPCPNELFYPLSTLASDWVAIDSNDPVQPHNGLVYSPAQVNASISGLPGLAITSTTDTSTGGPVLISGGYSTAVDLARGGTVSLDLLAASGDPQLQVNVASSVLIIDAAQDGLVAVYEDESNFEFDGNFSAVGVQIYRGDGAGLAQRVLLWAKSADPNAPTVYISHDLSHVDLSRVHTFSLEFNFEQNKFVNLLIDGTKETSLYGIPLLSGDTHVILHVACRRGYIPPTGIPPNPDPAVTTIFGNVSLPISVGGLCDHGDLFLSRGSPVVQFRAAVGTRPGAGDIVEFKDVLSPCLTCLSTTSCSNYRCHDNCTSDSPYTIPVQFDNLTLSPGQELNEQSNSSIDPQIQSALTTYLIGQFQPAVYFVTVEAITASGRTFTSSSNGVTMDTTPPTLVSAVEQFDISFSLQEPSLFQGNSHTIAASWLFEDLQSGVTEYLWAIGTSIYGQDIQALSSVGLETSAVKTNLSLVENTMYHVTVVAVNGAGLSSNATGVGITYVDSELDPEQLRGFSVLDSVDVLFTLPVNFTEVDVLRIVQDDSSGVSWQGIGADVQDIFWSIASESASATGDVFPSTRVSFNGSVSADIDNGRLLLDDQTFSSLAEVIAIAEGKAVDPADNDFHFEPGRLFYHSLEFCNFVHRCSLIDVGPTILFRESDVSLSPGNDGNIVSVTVTQDIPRGSGEVPTLNRDYSYTLSTSGLSLGSVLLTGYLTQDQVTQNYRVSTPYTSNPFLTMSQTSRELARRFTEIGGPSFYLSFLGQDSLLDVVDVNVTFDGGLDWSNAVPELAYWDIDSEVWREVGALCGGDSSIDWPSLTINVQVCSTLLDQTIASRPSSLSRRRRQTGSGSGSGPTLAPPSYLDRPTQFIVIRVGNTSSNTGPRLLLPAGPVPVDEDTQLQLSLVFEDDENDNVLFYLTSLPRLGSATLTLDGLLTFVPCSNCIGIEVLDIYIIEEPLLETQTPESATGQLLILVENTNDNPELYFYSNLSSVEFSVEQTITAYIDANRTTPTNIGSIGAFDFDGLNDDLSIFVQNGQFGSASSEVWLDAVNVPQSLPIKFTPGSVNPVLLYSDYVAFVGAYITYLPADPNFTGTDTVRVQLQDSNQIPSGAVLVVNVEVLPSLCENNGVCEGSASDPDCSDYNARRTSFEGYNCSCPSGYQGRYCEVPPDSQAPAPIRDCPLGVPMVQCLGDPCASASCPSHPGAVCTPDYCGACSAQWAFPNGTQVNCHYDIPGECKEPDIANAVFPSDCTDVTCDCPPSQFDCPPDSIISITRVDGCCLSYECVCPDISCPLLMEKGLGVQPVAQYRGNQFPGRCCPLYDYLDINECQDDAQNMCTDVCTNVDGTYSCSCPAGTTLARNGLTCGVCPYNGVEYLLGDRVMIGCNWCICLGDNLSGERWQCSAAPCERGCFTDGVYYPLYTSRTEGVLSCSCQPTDTSAEWSCATNL